MLVILVVNSSEFRFVEFKIKYRGGSDLSMYRARRKRPLLQGGVVRADL